MRCAYVRTFLILQTLYKHKDSDYRLLRGFKQSMRKILPTPEKMADVRGNFIENSKTAREKKNVMRA